MVASKDNIAEGKHHQRDGALAELHHHSKPERDQSYRITLLEGESLASGIVLQVVLEEDIGFQVVGLQGALDGEREA